MRVNGHCTSTAAKILRVDPIADTCLGVSFTVLMREAGMSMHGDLPYLESSVQHDPGTALGASPSKAGDLKYYFSLVCHHILVKCVFTLLQLHLEH